MRRAQRMDNGVVRCGLVGLALALASISVARAEPADDEDAFYTQARAAPDGDWLTNAGPVRGLVASGPDQPGALWRVVSPLLACRATPAPEGSVGHVFMWGAIIQADLGRGGSDEVMLNAADAGGQHWMRVRSLSGTSLDCFVRAHRGTIAAVAGP